MTGEPGTVRLEKNGRVPVDDPDYAAVRAPR